MGLEKRARDMFTVMVQLSIATEVVTTQRSLLERESVTLSLNPLSQPEYAHPDW